MAPSSPAAPGTDPTAAPAPPLPISDIAPVIEPAPGHGQAMEPSAAQRGIFEKGMIYLFGASWQTTLFGILGGLASMAPLLPEDAPHWIKMAAQVVTGLSIAFLGANAKSTKVTGVK